MTIKERATEKAEFAGKQYFLSDVKAMASNIAYSHYMMGATDQRKIDIKKACNIYADLLSAQGYNLIDVNKEVVRMKQAMEEENVMDIVSEWKEEVNEEELDNLASDYSAKIHNQYSNLKVELVDGLFLNDTIAKAYKAGCRKGWEYKSNPRIDFKIEEVEL